MTTTVTSKTGKQIDISIDNTCTSIVAKAGDISFGAEQTATGFKTRFPLTLGGKRTHIEVTFEGAELAKVQALFAELADGIDRRSAAQAQYDRQHAAVLKMMAA